jgi:dihydropyrimidinase
MKQPSTATLLIRDGTLVTVQGLIDADILVQGERIRALGRELPESHDTQIVDAAGCFVLPGVIDAHTHIQLDTGVYRTPDDWLAGTRAAACGGVTTVVDFATQYAGQTLREAIKARLEEAEKGTIDYALHVMVTDVPPGREDELADLVDLGATSVKLYTTYRPTYYADDATILRLLKACASLGLLPLVHCENDDLVTARTGALVAEGKTGWRYHGCSRPVLAEQEAVQRMLFLAEAAESPIHICHCSSPGSVALVAEARDNGQFATCETCPQYLLLDNGVYEGPEPWRYVLQPPLRAPEETDWLWAMVEGGMVDSIVTDHCDYTRAQKLAHDDFIQTPGGLPGLETLLPLMYTFGAAAGRVTLPDLVGLLSTTPARVWGLWPRKGTLQPGSDADVVVYDPAPEGVISAETLHHVAGYTPYEGMPVQGRVKATISRGQVIYREGRFTGREGRGRFLARDPLDGAA